MCNISLVGLILDLADGTEMGAGVWDAGVGGEGGRREFAAYFVAGLILLLGLGSY